MEAFTFNTALLFIVTLSAFTKKVGDSLGFKVPLTVNKLAEPVQVKFVFNNTILPLFMVIFLNIVSTLPSIDWPIPAKITVALLEVVE